MKEIIIEYDGKRPNLCSGNLTVIIDGVKWEFSNYCLSSGGSVNWRRRNSKIKHGKWSIRNWPEGFPSDMKEEVLNVINEKIPASCCGGCL